MYQEMAVFTNPTNNGGIGDIVFHLQMHVIVICCNHFFQYWNHRCLLSQKNMQRVFQKMRLLNKSDKVLLEHLRIFSIDRKIEGSIHEMEINFEKSSR